MLRISICDDSSQQLGLMQSALLNYLEQKEDQPEIVTFDSSLLFLENLDQTGGYDIALLDICMPGILGTDVAREIRRRRDKTEIIFLTNSDEYAVDAFTLKAAHYLLKPFTQAEFNEAMDRAMDHFVGGATKRIPVKPEGGGVQMVELSDILYIESQRHILTVYTKMGAFTEGQRSLSRFLEELEKLSPRQFQMPYKGYLVNLKAITAIEPERIVLRGGSSIPIPKRGFRDIQNAYFDYLFPEGGERK